MSRIRLLVGLFALVAGLLFVASPASALRYTAAAGNPITGLGQTSDIATGDFNNDGRSDVAIASTGSPAGTFIRLANANGTFTSATTIDSDQNDYAVKTGDLNADGKMDLVVVRFNQTIKSFLGIGDGTFAAGQTVAYGGGGIQTGNRNAISIGDVVGTDNHVDLVIGGIQGNYGVAQGNGDGTFATATPTAVTGAPSGADNGFASTIGDFNGDGHKDIALGSDAIYVLLGNSGGTLTQDALNPHALGAPTGTIDSLASADFNSDGRADVAASSRFSDRDGSIQAWFGSVANVLDHVSGNTITSGNQPTNVLASDFNGDGRPDVGYLTNYTATGPNQPYNGFDVAFSSNAGDFLHSPDNHYGLVPPETISWGFATGDFNGDGSIDVTAASVSTNSVPVYLSSIGLASDPTSVAAGNQVVGTESSTVLTLQNYGTPTAHIHMTLTGTDSASFQRSVPIPPDPSYCGSVSNVDLSAQQTCKLDIKFHPNDLGAKSATLHITSDEGPTYDIPLTGTGVDPPVPGVIFSPGVLQFDHRNVDTTSTPQAFTLTSTGNVPLEIGNVEEGAGDSGSFEIVNGSDTCSNASIDPGLTCRFEVVFKPQSAIPLGDKSLVISVPNNDPDSALPSPVKQSVLVTGKAVDPHISVSPGSKDFGEVAIGTPDSTRVFTISSTGPVASPSNPGEDNTVVVSNSDITLTGADKGDFSMETPLGCGYLNPGSACTVKVHFHPLESGAALRTANLRVASTATDSPTNVALTGTAAFGGFTISPNPIDFGEQRLGHTSPVKAVTITSNGTAPLQLGAIDAGGPDYDQYDYVSDTCSSQTIPVGQTCQVGITFTPSRLGDLSASGFGFDFPGGGNGTDVHGTGINPAGSFTAAASFGSIDIGSVSGGPTKALVFTAVGETPSVITSAAISGPNADDFKFVNPAACNGSFVPTATCSLTVTFKPLSGSAGARTATATIETNNGTFTANLDGTATVPVVPATKEMSLKLKAPKKIKRGKKLVVNLSAKNIGTTPLGNVVFKAKIQGPVKKHVVILKWTDSNASVGRATSSALTASYLNKLRPQMAKSAKPGKKITVKVTATSDGERLGSAQVVSRITA